MYLNITNYKIMGYRVSNKMSEKIDAHIKSCGGETSLNQIARNENIDLIFGDLTSVGASGIIKYIKEEDKFKIYINSRDSKERQKFTLAHELGHYFLHRDDLEKMGAIGDLAGMLRGDYDGLTNEEKNRELEANEFAGRLIMPKDKIEEYFKKTDGDVLSMASYFGVSFPAMKYRLTNLNLI